MTSLPGAGLRRTCAAAQHGADSPGELGNGNEVDSHDDAVAGRHLANATVSGIDRQSIARDDDQASAIAALQDLRVTCAGTFAQNRERSRARPQLSRLDQNIEATAVEIVDLVWAPPARRSQRSCGRGRAVCTPSDAASD